MKKLLSLIFLIALALLSSCNSKKKLVNAYSTTDKSKIISADSTSSKETHSIAHQVATNTVKTDSGSVTTTEKTDIIIQFDSAGNKKSEIRHIEKTRQIQGTSKTNTRDSSSIQEQQVKDSLTTHHSLEQRNIKSKGRSVSLVTKPSYGWIPWAVGVLILLVAGVFVAKKFSFI